MVEIFVAFGQWLGAFWNLTIIPGTSITCGTLAVICFVLVAIGLVIRSLYGGAMSVNSRAGKGVSSSDSSSSGGVSSK